MYALINPEKTMVVGPFKTYQEAIDYRAEASVRKDSIVTSEWRTIEVMKPGKF
jgi:hypothetical protein